MHDTIVPQTVHIINFPPTINVCVVHAKAA
jgi:hypothetical protein